jgi:hypothetical protein
MTVAFIVQLALLAYVLLQTPPNGERVEPDAASVEWVCERAPERVKLLFESVSLDRPGLEAVKSAVAAKDSPLACTALLDYYREARTAAWLRHRAGADTGAVDAAADTILSDTFVFYEERSKLARTKEGRIDWSYNGPKNDPEWGASLNTLQYVGALANAYFKTGRREYAARADADLRDWILSNPAPNRATRYGPWRGIEVAARARTWMSVFYGLQACDEFSPAARILMLSSLVEHANYLMLFHRREASNWTVTELDGLGAIGAAWPEFADAPGWRKYALEKMGGQMSELVYPDGSQAELAPLYQRITTEHFDRFADVFRKFGHRVPAPLEEGLDRMWSYLAYTLRPDGSTPENNDSDRRDIREKLIAAAKEHAHPDWLYIATRGAEGTAPGTGPSVMFPWAGQLIMRTGWDANATWAFFDTGPSGTGEPHRDKLHLSIDAFGRALLVDAARFNYRDDRWRGYFAGSAAHNVILIDGGQQKADVQRAARPLPATEYAMTPEYDFARGVFNAGFEGVRGDVIHTRVVLYVREKFWVIADRIETDRARKLEALWHFAPDCHVTIDGRDVVSDDADKGNLRITPVGGMRWTPQVVTGQDTPSVQGWYSPSYDEKVPAPTAVFRTDIPGTTTFAWVLVPARGEVSKVDARVISSRAERIEMRVQIAPEEWFVVTIPMNAWKPTVKRQS